MIFKTIVHEALLEGNYKKYYQTIADVSKWHAWNPSILHSSLDGEFAEGVKGMSMPRLHAFSPLVITKIIENKLIEMNFSITLGGIRVKYEFTEISATKTRIKVTRSISGISGLVTYMLKRKAFMKNFDTTLKAMEKYVSRMR